MDTDFVILKVSCLLYEAGPQEMSPALAEMPHKVLEVIIDSIGIVNLHHTLKKPACGKNKAVMGLKISGAGCSAICSIHLYISI